MSKPVPMPHSNTDDDLHNLRKPEPFRFGKFLYNSEEGTVMGRDRASWGKLGPATATKEPIRAANKYMYI